MSSKEHVFDDFAGGLFEGVAPSDFARGEHSVLRGVVYDNDAVLRSQWAVQRIGGLTGIASFAVLGIVGADWVVALKTDGTLWAGRVPFRTASDAETAAFTGWTQLTTATDATSGATVTIGADVSRRFLCQVPVPLDADDAAHGVLVNSLASDAPALVVYRHSQSELRVLSYSARYPSTYQGTADGTEDANGTVTYARDNVMPHANVGAMWGDVLCLADCYWYRNPNARRGTALVPLGGTLSSGKVNRKKYPSAFWTSTTDASGFANITAFHPDESLNDGFVSPAARILGMQSVQGGLLVVTSPTGFGSDGVVLLRGKPYNYTVEPIRTGIGLRNDYSDPDRRTTAWWPEAGVVTFVEQSAQVWHTDGQRADRLDRKGAKLSVGQASQDDHTAALRGYLFVFRQGRCLLLNMVATGAEGEDGTGVWTELVLPHGTAPVRVSEANEDNLYFVQNGELFRFQMDETRPRGTIDGAPITVEVATCPVAAGGPQQRGRWSRVAVRAHSPSGTGVLTGVKSWAGAPIGAGTPVLTTPVNRPLGESGQTVLAKGHGPSTVAAAGATFTGDVVLEAVTLVQAGVRDQRTGGVAGKAGDL